MLTFTTMPASAPPFLLATRGLIAILCKLGSFSSKVWW
jgi:hypothetical protein